MDNPNLPPDPSKKPKEHAHGHKPGHKVLVPATVVRANDDGENLLVEADGGAGQSNAHFNVPASIVVPAQTDEIDDVVEQ
jgi:hypothetical protein